MKVELLHVSNSRFKKAECEKAEIPAQPKQ